MAKLLALCAILTGFWARLPVPYLPFASVFDHLRAAASFRLALQAIFLAASGTLLLNRAVRTCCLALASVVFAALLCSRGYYESNRLFLGCLLLLLGLYAVGTGARLIRYQVSLVYFGAVVNKLFDADWRSGQFFENWATRIHPQAIYITAASLFPHMALAQVLSWLTILTELGLAIGFLFRPVFGIAIWTGILFHTVMFLVTGRTFGMFLYAMPAAYLAFAEWPGSPMTLIYDGDCGFCTRTRKLFEKLDVENAVHWVPLQLARADYGAGDSALQESIHLVDGGKVATGFRAFRKMVLLNPLTYFLFAFLLTVPFLSGIRKEMAVVLILLFSPIFQPLGEAIYRLVARNRQRLSSEQSCGTSAAHS